MSVFCVCYICFPEYEAEARLLETQSLGIASIQGNSFLPVSEPCFFDVKVVRTIKVIATAYSSTVAQTDDTPFVTAANTNVRDGIIANNLLPFGTQVMVPELYPDKVFVVEDRMHSRKGYYHIDIWFSTYAEAKEFGAKETYIEVLEN